MTRLDARRYALEIGEGIREDGRAYGNIETYASCASWWRDIIDTIGKPNALEAARRGYCRADVEIARQAAAERAAVLWPPEPRGIIPDTSEQFPEADKI